MSYQDEKKEKKLEFFLLNVCFAGDILKFLRFFTYIYIYILIQRRKFFTELIDKKSTKRIQTVKGREFFVLL